MTMLSPANDHRKNWFLAALFFSLVPAFGVPPKVAPVETHWPGITATVYQIARLPDNRVSVKFIYRALSNAPAETYIADRALTSFVSESDDPKQEPLVFYPYSLEKKGQLIDEATGQAFSSAELKANDKVHPGRMDALEVVRPDGAFFLGGVFKCPPISEDDPPKEQWITFNLPGLKKPLKGVQLPREENVPINYFPKPRTLPFGASEPPTPTLRPDN